MTFAILEREKKTILRARLTFSWESRDQMPFFPDAAAEGAAPPRPALRPASANDVIAPEVKEFKMELR